jgi:hypothetical protein
MNNNVITEIVSFDIDESIANEKFKEIVDSLEIEFHMLQSGYIDSELVKGRNNSWTMIMHWESVEEVKLASKLLMKSDLTKKFRQALIPSTVKMNYLEQIKKWRK